MSDLSNLAGIMDFSTFDVARQHRKPRDGTIFSCLLHSQELDSYFSFYGLVLDIDMNCGCRLYRSFCQMDLTYAMDCLLNSITGMNVAFLLTVSAPYTQL